MKRLLSLLLACLLAALWVLPAWAEDGQVTYTGNAGAFVFQPGSDASPTDLFPNFKDVMPGDVLTQQITLRNNADNQVVVKFFLTAASALEDADFLSRLRLQVTANVHGSQTWLYDGPDAAAGLDSPAWLGTLYNGGQVDLTVTLTVPTELDNDYQNRLGKLEWVFSVEEYPADSEMGHGYWTLGSDVDKIVTNILPSDSVTEVYFDGLLVPPDCYDIYADEEGQLIIKLHSDFLEQFDVGDHIISVRTEDGVLRDIYLLTILARGTPNTGDDSSLDLWLILALGSLALLTALVLIGRKRKGGDRHDERVL